MAADHSISPSPATIDRNAFGPWLSGFTDGEGCFFLQNGDKSSTSPRFRARFRIALRADDSPCLRLIQSFLSCGALVPADHRKRTDARRKPSMVFDVSRIGDLCHRVLPQFDAYPLHSKKAGDYVIWRQAVELIYTVSLRPCLSAGRRRGRITRWLPEEIDRFVALHSSLKEHRRYRDLGAH